MMHPSSYTKPRRRQIRPEDIELPPTQPIEIVLDQWVAGEA